MSDIPAPVRLDDLAHPRFAPALRDLMVGAAPLGEAVVLEVDAILDQACAETGLDDFGDAGFREPLTVLLAALRDEAGLSPFGRLSVHTQLVQAARNRLLVEDLLRRHPEIHDLEVARPIVIAGLPRTGTTHLHNLLAADPALRSLPYWEALEPVLAADEQPGPGEPDPRLARTDAALDIMHAALPHLDRMHEMTTWHVHEEIQLLALSFSTMYFDTIAPMPSWREHYRSADQTPHYEYLRTLLKVLQFTRGGERWVLKSPQHLEQFAVIRRVFPDATVVVTHRDPVSVTLSMATMVAYTSRVSHATPVRVERIARYWLDLLSEMLDTCAGERDLLGSQAIDVHFDAFMADDLATVDRIYDLAGQPMTDDARTAIGTYLEGHGRGRHGRVLYDFGDLGLDEAEMSRRFAGYVERFGVTLER